MKSLETNISKKGDLYGDKEFRLFFHILSSMKNLKEPTTSA